ncbi:aminotransferase class IV [Singulisphaera acidiphila]|uniref:Branched-chain amino acid aminotransferase/4-amino-4-deoxychorismate lyase n=1 Tax=Singulisphaera acidiphila (strain ATCC BAA-1392 / DSM 18658 / VKM B-2454 / MOB10) TaxID=886293 RepID=L0DAH0_SINAD|nr:aminotransferase class IV [Singulisphaera acidiphila]AGA25855.1 branched-chain amino acid aminotransferase/4-amino-4-deoxychorismate lyase [Singulisphaera acidiphila DSM 18658]
MESLACLNGELMPVDEARVPIWDRGFLFGDAVYEVMRIYQGRCWLEEAHMGRLKRSLASMEFPTVDLTELVDRMNRTIAASGVQEGTAYLHITRGVAPRAHAFPDPASVPPTELIVIRDYDDAKPAQNRVSGVAMLSHPELRWKRCDVKSTNLLANVMAHEAAHRAGCFEAILVGEDGLVTEATHSSVLWVRDGRLEGTPEGNGILPGTTRQFLVKEAGAAGIPFAEARLSLDELKQADEVLLVGTTIEIYPVIRIDDAPISGGQPGDMSRRLQALFRESVERWLAPQPV